MIFGMCLGGCLPSACRKQLYRGVHLVLANWMQASANKHKGEPCEHLSLMIACSLWNIYHQCISFISFVRACGLFWSIRAQSKALIQWRKGTFVSMTPFAWLVQMIFFISQDCRSTSLEDSIRKHLHRLVYKKIPTYILSISLWIYHIHRIDMASWWLGRGCVRVHVCSYGQQTSPTHRWYKCTRTEPLPTVWKGMSTQSRANLQYKFSRMIQVLGHVHAFWYGA